MAQGALVAVSKTIDTDQHVATAESLTLWAVVSAEDYAERVARAVGGIADSEDPASAQVRLVECVDVLGAESAFFANVVRDGPRISACRFMLACDPGWFRHRLDRDDLAKDPWLAYAAHHSEPVLASDIRLDEPESPALREPAALGGFASAYLVPTHSGLGNSRTSLLVLGSTQTGYFEREGLGRLRLGARALAAELHDWWLARRRRELLAKTRITPEELELLRLERQGHCSKHIAKTIDSTASAVNSRFQRLNVKMGAPNRRAAARLAVDSGLLPF